MRPHCTGGQGSILTLTMCAGSIMSQSLSPGVMRMPPPALERALMWFQLRSSIPK